MDATEETLAACDTLVQVPKQLKQPQSKSVTRTGVGKWGDCRLELQGRTCSWVVVGGEAIIGIAICGLHYSYVYDMFTGQPLRKALPSL